AATGWPGSAALPTPTSIWRCAGPRVPAWTCPGWTRWPPSAGAWTPTRACSARSGTKAWPEPGHGAAPPVPRRPSALELALPERGELLAAGLGQGLAQLRQDLAQPGGVGAALDLQLHEIAAQAQVGADRLAHGLVQAHVFVGLVGRACRRRLLFGHGRHRCARPAAAGGLGQPGGIEAVAHRFDQA